MEIGLFGEKKLFQICADIFEAVFLEYSFNLCVTYYDYRLQLWHQYVYLKRKDIFTEKGSSRIFKGLFF